MLLPGVNREGIEEYERKEEEIKKICPETDDPVQVSVRLFVTTLI